MSPMNGRNAADRGEESHVTFEQRRFFAGRSIHRALKNLPA
jgi:hypothetical protein